MDNVVPFIKIPSGKEAEKIIKELVARGRISWSTHCKQRMKERDITIPQIINCLTKGRVMEEPFLSFENGEGYETSMEKVTAGEWLKVVVCLKITQELLVITAIK